MDQVILEQYLQENKITITEWEQTIDKMLGKYLYSRNTHTERENYIADKILEWLSNYNCAIWKK